jgi:GT2 family glycosyltransferase
MVLSVCIPTYKRHDYLVECLQSVFASTVRPLEIVVSDDAHEAALEARFAALPVPDDVTLRYVANHRGRRQAANVHNAFAHATHELVVLMHDDDYFLPGGLDALWRAWQAAANDVDAVFGRRRIVDAAGRFQPKLTARGRRKWHFSEPGLVSSNLWSALMLQFPANGMMLRRSVVLAAGVPLETEVGHHTDLHFGIRYAFQATRPFLLIADEVSAYRHSSTSVRRSDGVFELDGHLDYTALEAIKPPGLLERAALQQALDRSAHEAILAFAARGERRRVLELFSRHWRRMRAPLLTRLKIAVVAAGMLVGVRWPEDRLRRQYLGLRLNRPRLPGDSSP